MRSVSYAWMILLAILSAFAQEERGKAELDGPGASVTVNYGRPSLKGRDMISKLSVGDYWRLGKDNVTILSSTANLFFGATQIGPGSYSLWLKRVAPEKYDLVFNRQTTGHGMVHKADLDVTSVPLNKATLSDSVEILRLELKPASRGGSLVISWATAELVADFQFGK